MTLISEPVAQAGAGAAMDAGSLEAAVQAVAAENLELGCALIEKAATDKALRDMDESLAPAFAQRRAYREGQARPS